MSRVPVQVLVVGGGAAGVIAATALVEAPGVPVDVRVVERSGPLGSGLAYATAAPQHLLNNYASRMSARLDDPDDLLRWCAAEGLPVDGDAFLPRREYGRYLASLLDRARPTEGSRITRLTGEVVDLQDTESEYVATLASGGQAVADVVVLALGNPPPRDVSGLHAATRGYVADPWSPDLVDRVRRGDRVLLVGSGLTAVDVATQLAAVHRDVEMVAVSRHGMLPRVHRATAPPFVPPYERVGTTLTALLADLRRRRAGLDHDGADWRDLVEAVKLVANDVWKEMSGADQDTFIRHAARHWEVVRHRMAPQVAEVVEGLLLDGRLRVVTPEQVGVAEYDVVVNCTGPAPACTPGWNPLVDALAARGLLRPGPHGLGLDVDADGRLVDGEGAAARGIHVLGAARRGSEWEVAAVPDLRRQAGALAAVVGIQPASVRELVG